MILRRTVLCAMLAVAAVPGPSYADSVEPTLEIGGSASVPVGECGGFAPESRACTFPGTMPAASTVHLEAQPEFTGRIGVSLVTDTGRYTASCDFLGANEPVCRSSTSGTLIIGQAFDAYATASLASPVDGSEFPLAIGRWRVFITAP